MRRTTLITAAVVSLGCNAEPTEPAPTASCGPPECERPSPSPYEPNVEDEDAVPGLSADDAATLLPELLTEAASFSPSRVFALYEGMMASGDDACPGAYELPSDPSETNVLWVNDCVATDGTRFYGYVQVTTFDRLDEEGIRDQGFVFSSGGITFEIEAPDGSFLRGSLYLEYHTLNVPDGSVHHYGFKFGDLLADEEAAAGDAWLGGHVGGAFDFYAFDYEGARALVYNGNLATGRDDVTALDLRELSVDAVACPISVLGSAALRDADGGWHDATFGDPEGLGTGAECDACGELSFGDAELGSFCSSEAPLVDLLAWETTPW